MFACFPLRSEWEATLPPVVTTYPAPVLSSREPSEEAAPSSVRKLAQFAAAAGWGVRVGQSKGCVPHGSTGRPGAVKTLWGLRFGAHLLSERRAYAVYASSARTFACTSVMIWGPDLPPYAHCGVTELKVYLERYALLSEAELRGWVSGLEAVRQESEAMRKRRATVRAQIIKVADAGRIAAARQETRLDFALEDMAWRSKVADLQDGVFTSEEVAAMIDPARRRSGGRSGLQ